MTPIRMQIFVSNTLKAEVIGTSDYLEMIWAKWCNKRYPREMGSSITQRADMPRFADVKIGEQV